MITRKETDEETQKRILELCKHLLGEDWYTNTPANAEQINTEIVYAIEYKYRKRVPIKIRK